MTNKIRVILYRVYCQANCNVTFSKGRIDKPEIRKKVDPEKSFAVKYLLHQLNNCFHSTFCNNVCIKKLKGRKISSAQQIGKCTTKTCSAMQIGKSTKKTPAAKQRGKNVKKAASEQQIKCSKNTCSQTQIGKSTKKTPPAKKRGKNVKKASSDQQIDCSPKTCSEMQIGKSSKKKQAKQRPKDVKAAFSEQLIGKSTQNPCPQFFNFFKNKPLLKKKAKTSKQQIPQCTPNTCVALKGGKSTKKKQKLVTKKAKSVKIAPPKKKTKAVQNLKQIDKCTITTCPTLHVGKSIKKAPIRKQKVKSKKAIKGIPTAKKASKIAKTSTKAIPKRSKGTNTKVASKINTKRAIKLNKCGNKQCHLYLVAVNKRTPNNKKVKHVR